MKTLSEVERENRHILVCLGEEGAEIAQGVSKSLRFGIGDRYKKLAKNPGGLTNKQRLVNEINDLHGVIELLVERGVLPRGWWSWKKVSAKKQKVLKFIRYAKKVGAL